MKKLLILFCVAFLLVSCGELPETFKINYYDNGSTSGFPPTDNNEYTSGSYAVVLGRNTLLRTGYTFEGWNTSSDGSGTSYAVGEKIKIENKNIFLYAVWKPNPLGILYRVIYQGNGNTSGLPPTDDNEYASGSYAIVLYEPTLKKTNYKFDGWNTSRDGSGTSYAVGSEIEIKDVNIYLYAVWKWENFIGVGIN